jgi:hypothetical protein
VARFSWILRRIMLRAGFHDFGQRNVVLSASPPGSLIQGAAESEIVNVPVVCPFFFQWQDAVRQTDLEVVQSVETHISTLCPKVIRPTPMAEGGSPGPGLRGSALGARVSGLRQLRSPSLRGRPIQVLSTDSLPDSQKCSRAVGESPLELDVRT